MYSYKFVISLMGLCCHTEANLNLSFSEHYYEYYLASLVRIVNGNSGSLYLFISCFSTNGAFYYELTNQSLLQKCLLAPTCCKDNEDERWNTIISGNSQEVKTFRLKFCTTSSALDIFSSVACLHSTAIHNFSVHFNVISANVHLIRRHSCVCFDLSACNAYH